MGPRNARKPFSGSNTKAPPRPKSKGQRPAQAAQADAGGGGDRGEEDASTSGRGGGSSGGKTSGGGAAGGGGRSKKSQRSFLGFVGVAASAVALWGWAVLQHAGARRRNRAVLDGMLRRPLTFTEHAACRMDCRFVTRQQVAAALRQGELNAMKSDLAARPCPKVVVDAELASGAGGRKAVQAVFAACRAETRVVTVIDKSTNWPCGPC